MSITNINSNQYGSLILKHIMCEMLINVIINYVDVYTSCTYKYYVRNKVHKHSSCVPQLYSLCEQVSDITG